MVRLLSILLIALAGMPRLGIDLAGGPTVRETVAACSAVRAEQGCCTTGGGSCPMSGGMKGGPCRCAAPKTPPQPRPETPAPQSRNDRGAFTALPDEPTRVAAVEPSVSVHPAASRPAVHEEASHNEIRAFLGIWRT